MAHVKDPVCGMEIDASDAVAQMSFQGNTYFFCCEKCRQAFEADPGKYVGVATGGDDPRDNET